MSQNKVLERAKLHFQPQRTTPKTIHIPEWADPENPDDNGVFHATALNLKERQNIDKSAKDDIELGVDVVIAKLQDADGNRIFNRADKPEIMRSVDPQVISRVAQEILGSSDLEEAEKN